MLTNRKRALLHLFNVTGLPGPGEKRLLRTVEAENDEEALAWERGQVVLAFARSLGSEVRRGRRAASGREQPVTNDRFRPCAVCRSSGKPTFAGRGSGRSFFSCVGAR